MNAEFYQNKLNLVWIIIIISTRAHTQNKRFSVLPMENVQ